MIRDAVTLHPLGEPDLPAVQQLIERCADYYVLAEGQPPAADAAHELWTVRPPGMPPSAKHLVGVRDPGLVGVLDVIEDWPVPGTWLIGLLLLEPRVRGHGLGTRAVELVRDWASDAGAERLRVAVLPANEGALAFWTRLGFTPVPSTSPSAVALERTLAAP